MTNTRTAGMPACGTPRTFIKLSGMDRTWSYALAARPRQPGMTSTHADLEGHRRDQGLQMKSGGPKDRVPVAGSRVTPASTTGRRRADLDDEFVGGEPSKAGGLAAEFAGDRSILHGVFPLLG